MKTTAVLLALTAAYIAVDTLPAALANTIGLGFIIVTLTALIAAIIAIGKAAK